MKDSLRVVFFGLFFCSRIFAANPAVQAINEGGVRIFGIVERGSEGNLCLSPFSIQSALAMTSVGARGVTREQMASALGFPKSPEELASGFLELNGALQKSMDGRQKDISLHVANRLFGAADFSFRADFLHLLERKFSAPLETLNFKKSPSRATETINRWVEERTEKRIRNLIPENALTEETALVLVNALYLKVPWSEEFSQAATKLLPFSAFGREKVSVPTMMRTGTLGYLKAGGFVVVGIPFQGGDFQFLIFLPQKPENLSCPSARLLEMAGALPSEEVRLFLPKFRLEPPTISLAEVLQSLGIKAAFDIPRGSADFDGMAPRRPADYLFLSDVFHKTFFALDEKGVEAAAATAVVMMRYTAAPVQREPVEVRVDRPFFFAVQHRPTGACLFLGRIADPR